MAGMITKQVLEYLLTSIYVARQTSEITMRRAISTHNQLLDLEQVVKGLIEKVEKANGIQMDAAMGDDG
jgi:hypothetical protein